MADLTADQPISWHTRLLYFLGNIPHLQSNKSQVLVDDGVSFQKISGFGGAITGSVVHNLGLVPEALEDLLLESYYSNKTGIAYNMLRMAIGGSDFDLAPWAYNELPRNDKDLTNFHVLDPRDLAIVKRIKKVQAHFKEGEHRALKIKAAAWGCPRWMRDPGRRRGGPGVLKPEYYQTWANYHLRFLELMKAQGIDIWALSPGNEPMNGIIGWIVTPWMTLGWHAKDVAKYIAENLGPSLRNSPFNKTLILAGDDQRTMFPWYFENMKSAYPESFDYIAGLAVHSYLDRYLPADMLNIGQEAFPDKFIINSESSIGDVRYNPRGPLLGSWARGVEYMDMFIQSFKNSVSGWIDWNLALDERGGPNYVNNTVDTPIVVNTTSRTEAYKQPIFYAIGHFSKFIPEDSVRIDVQSDWGEVDTIGFRRPDKAIVVIIHNRYLEGVEVTLKDAKQGTKVLQLPPDSITTVVYQALS